MSVTSAVAAQCAASYLVAHISRDHVGLNAEHARAKGRGGRRHCRRRRWFGCHDPAALRNRPLPTDHAMAYGCVHSQHTSLPARSSQHRTAKLD